MRTLPFLLLICSHSLALGQLGKNPEPLIFQCVEDWRPVGLPEFSPHHVPLSPGLDDDYIYYVASGVSTSNQMTARQQALGELYGQIEQSLYRELSRHNHYLNEAEKPCVRKKIGTAGVIILEEHPYAVAQRFAFRNKKNKTGYQNYHQVDIRARYSQLDFKRVLREILNNNHCP